MLLEVITPDKKIFEGDVSSVTFPGSDGEFQVLPNHAPMISSLGKGKMTINTSGKEQKVMINDGVVEVFNNNVTVLADAVVD